MKYLIPKSGAKLTVGLMNSNQKVLCLYDEWTCLCCKDGKIWEHSKNVWQTLRIEADTETNTAKVRLNGKVCSTIGFDSEADFIDKVEIELNCKRALEFQFAELRAFVIPPYPADYVPEPVIPKKKGDYYVGINICSLWREGTHYGWDCVSPFPENRPVIGYYDEGIPETSDWELKFMSEHGIDFQLYCWYAAEAQKPMLKSSLSSAIYEGHMLARYPDKVKIALLWESLSSRAPRSFEDVRDYIFPYFIDYFFSDPRYMQIDGKAVISIYRPQKLMKDLGGPAEFRRCFDYLKKQLKKLGYKGLILLGCGDSQPLYKEAGIEGVHCYNWHKDAYDVTYTKSRVLSNIREGSVHQVPCLSMGYNDVAWAGKRYRVIEPSDMVTLLEWFKNELLDKYPDKKSWKSKLVMLSTWNEYGEGTYMMPAGVHGFGYLDALRKVFCEDVPHIDVVPNENQKARICNLYPRDRIQLAAYDNLPEDTCKPAVVKKYEFKSQKDLEKWEIVGLSNYEIRDGKLCGHSDRHDPYMILHDDEFLPVETDKIGKIVANCRTYRPVMSACCVQNKYMFEKDKWYDEMSYCISDPDKVVPLEMEPAKEKEIPWHGTVYGFRFDPVYAVGDFELESVTFYQAKPKKELYIDGNIIDMKHNLQEIDGVVYIPFDPRSPFKNIPNLYFEWNKPKQTLSLYSEKQAHFTANVDVALVDNCKMKLQKALSFFDGLPLIEAKLFADIVGRRIVIGEKEVHIDF